VLYSGDRKVAQKVVRVNSPLSYHGINFYQASFGEASRMQVKINDSVIFDGTVPLDRTVVNEGVARYAGKFVLTGNLTALLLSHSYNGVDPIIGENQTGVYIFQEGQDLPIAADVITMGVPTIIEGADFTFVGSARYSVFQVTRSPGLTLLWIACGTLILGLGLVFYLPYRQLWVLIEPGKAGLSHLTVRGAGRSSPGMNDINNLMEQIKRKL
jgi:cytochrome c biogenesis protein